MKDLNEIKKVLNEHKDELKKKYNVKQIGIFGSYARGEQKDSSDVDIVIELEKPLGLEFVSLAYHLEEILGVKVELVTYNALKQKPRLWESVKDDLVYV